MTRRNRVRKRRCSRDADFVEGVSQRGLGRRKDILCLGIGICKGSQVRNKNT